MDEVKKFFLVCAENIERIDDVIDNALAPFKDYVDTASELVKPINTIREIVTLVKRNRLKEFASNYAKKINQNVYVNEKERKNIEKYMEKDENRELLGNIIDSALNSNCNKCSAILGYYAGKILNELINIEYKDMIIVNALRSMNDYDLKYFYKLYQYIKDENLCEKSPSGTNIFFLKKEDEFKLKFNVLIIGQKLKSIQVINSDENEVMSGCNAIFIGVITEISDYLFSIIKESQIYLE